VLIKIKWAERRRAATSRAPAPHPAQGHPLSQAAPSHAPAPRGSWESARAARCHVRAVTARCAPRTAGPSAVHTVHAPAEATVPRPHLQGRALVSTSEPPYLNRASFPLLAPPPLSVAPSAPPPVSSPPRLSSSAPKPP
jgi:hypothetical protein